jgi:hypothetical protein
LDVVERFAEDEDRFEELDAEPRFVLAEERARDVVFDRLAAVPRRVLRPPDIWSSRRSSSSIRCWRSSIVLVRRWSSSTRARIVFATPTNRSAPGASDSL